MDRKLFYSKTRKFARLARSRFRGRRPDSVGFVRFIPTDRCNLHCTYCWQRKEDSEDMTLDAFKRYLEKAVDLGAGLVSFLGGEPMLWEGIYEAIGACTRNDLLCDLTTNGTLLSETTIRKLGESGLDYLNVSTDGLKISSVSKKNLLARRQLIGTLRQARRQYGMHVRLNAVIYKDNFADIQALTEFAREQNIPLSIGYVVPSLQGLPNEQSGYCFSLEDRGLIESIVDYLLEKKRAGYPIIDPDAYFKGVFRYLRGERFWNCNYPTGYGWINVAPGGKIRSCTKKMDELAIDFLELDRPLVRRLRECMRNDLEECNAKCYSNCAYDSSYYVRHKLQFAAKILGRFIPG
jgi:MoaA/NifB/PqqE/SkfB family radical SAM enzyme